MLRQLILPSAKFGNRLTRRFYSQSQSHDNRSDFLDSLAWFLISAAGTAGNGYLYWRTKEDYKLILSPQGYNDRRVVKGTMTVPSPSIPSDQIILFTVNDELVKLYFDDLDLRNSLLKNYGGSTKDVYVYGRDHSDGSMTPYYVGNQKDAQKKARKDICLWSPGVHLSMTISGMLCSALFMYRMKRSLF